MLFTTRDIFIMATPGCMETELDSLESVITGNDAGATGHVLKIDMTADGIAVLCGRGSFALPDESRISLAESSFGEIRQVHQKIVTIGQGIETVKSCGGKLCIDLRNTAVCAQVKLALTHADYIDFTYFTGLTLEDAARLAKAHPALHFMADVSAPPNSATAFLRSIQDSGLFGVRIAPAAMTRDICQEAHRIGLYIASTETHDEAVLDAMINMGVNFIETTRPDIGYNLLPHPDPEEETPPFNIMMQ